MNLQNVTDITDGELGWDKSKVSILGVKSLLTVLSKAFPGLWKTDLSCPEIDLYFCYVSHKMTSPFCWLFIDLHEFTKIVCFYDVWIFPPWIQLQCFEFETIYVKTSKKMSNPTKIQLSYFGWIGEIMSWSENY